MGEHGFDAQAKSFGEIMTLDKRRAYVIPLYQRRYVWGAEENQRLWDDVLTVIDNKEERYFLGSVVLMKFDGDDNRTQPETLKKEGYDLYYIVDGQQRLTSLSLILAALRKDMMITKSVFLEKIKESADYIREQQDGRWSQITAGLMNRLLTNISDPESSEAYTKIPRLIVPKGYYDAYRSISNGAGAPNRYWKINKTYERYLEWMKEKRERDLNLVQDIEGGFHYPGTAEQILDYYEELANALTERLLFVRIECDADEDAYQVFESLNGTGIGLSFTDRIKNIVMGRAVSGERMKASHVEEQWKEIEDRVGGSKEMDRFILSYLFVVTGHRVSKKRATKAFQDECINQHESIAGLLTELKDAADMYGTIVMDGAYGNEKKRLSAYSRELVNGILLNRPRQGVVPLLAAARRYGLDLNGRPSVDFRKVAQALLVLFVRHRVCDLPTNIIDRYTSAYCAAMENGTVDDVIKMIKEDYPDVDRFWYSFKTMTFETKDLERARYYLAQIEDKLRGKMKGEGPLNEKDVEDLTVEHVIPQTLRPTEWFRNEPELGRELEDDEGAKDRFIENTVQSIGNMCLLRRGENSKAGNKDYASKISLYETPNNADRGFSPAGTFCLVKQLVDNEMTDGDKTVEIVTPEDPTFDAEVVKRRAEVLADYAVRIWN